MKHDEGGYAERAMGPGGAVNMGISFAEFSGWRHLQGLRAPTFADLKAMSWDEARAIYHIAMIQRPLIEGTAIVLGVFDEACDLYWVRFAGETVPRVRLVQSGSWQSEPDATLCALLAHWREAHALEALGPFLSDGGLTTREGR